MKHPTSNLQRPTPNATWWRILPLVAIAAAGSLSAVGQSTNAPAAAPARMTFDAFRMVSDRNIFNPNRYARSSGRTAPRTSSQPAARVESISLVGVLAYDKGYYAFFDGTSSAYKQAIQTGGTIGQYHVTQVAPELVRLVVGTNTFDLKVGMQMRREDEGEWFLSEGGDAPRKRIVSTRSRTRGGVRGDSSGSGGSEETMDGSEPEVIVLEGDSQNQNETPAVEPTPNGNGNGDGGGGASTAEAGDSGETDPVLRALMERRRNALNR
jgi:hypothetical protein